MVHHMSRKINFATTRWTGFPALAALLLTGCASQNVPPAAEPLAQLQGKGFSIMPPSGSGWRIGAYKPDTIVFQKYPDKARQQANFDSYMLSAGVQAGVESPRAQHSNNNFVDEARAILAQRLSVPERDTILLEVTPATLQGATCAAYRSVQIDHYFSDRIKDRNEYAQRGLLCRHPSSSTLP